jgi:signal transduction histidine kinase
MKTRSIAFRLIVAVLAVELVSSLLVVFLSLGYERHAHFRAFDIMLRGRADSVLGAVQDAEDAADNVMLDQADLHLPADEIYEVYDSSGRLLGRSPNWQGSSSKPAAQAPDGFSHRVINQHQYRFLLLHGSRIVDPGEPGGGKLRQVTLLYGAPTDHVWHAIRSAVEFYAAGSVLLLLVTGPLIAWLLHRGLLPLRQLAALASQVSVDAWEFSPPASARTTPELAPLTQAIENVLQRLEQSFLQQRAFVSDAAHELKTAVAVVKSSLQLLGLKQRTTEEYRVGLERCLDDSKRLEELVVKMLTLARVESASSVGGAAGANSPQACDMAASLRQTVTQLETVADLRNVQVVVNTSAGSIYPVPLAADDCSLLVSNLLLNALQHSPPEVKIQLRLSVDAGTVELAVEDHGEGIDPAVLPHVFERFYRGDPSRTRSTGGAGLGLAICKAVAERAGGAISIASQSGQGTTVTVRLPLAHEWQINSAPPSA